MIPSRPIRSILAATDLLTAPEAFVRNSAAFATAAGADLHFLHVHHDGSKAGIGARDWLETQKELHQRRIALRNLLEQALPGGTIPATARVTYGSPAEAILLNADECNADLVILGPHRHHQIGDRYLGSTAERLLHTATVPCLILNSAMRTPVRHILVPADFSAPSRSALRCGMTWVRALSDRGQVEIDFVHVTAAHSDSEAGSRSTANRRQELEAEVRSITEDAATKVPVHVHVIEEADPIGALTRFADTRATDLVIMGTKGDSVFFRALLGSVSSGMLRRSSLPLLLVPPLAFAEVAEEEIDLPMQSIQPIAF